MDRQARPTNCEIYVRGLLGETLLSAFPELHAQSLDGETVLVGALTDQAALHGVLSRIEALGLELLEVRRVPTQPETAAEAGERGAPAARRQATGRVSRKTASTGRARTRPDGEGQMPDPRGVAGT